MECEDPDIARMLRLLDSSSSPYKSDEVFGEEGGVDGEVRYGAEQIDNGGSGSKPRGGGEYGSGQEALPPSTQAQPGRNDDYANVKIESNSEPHQQHLLLPLLPRIILHPGHAPRRAPAVTANLPHPAPPVHGNPRQTQPSGNHTRSAHPQASSTHQVKMESLGGPQPPADAIYGGMSSHYEQEGNERDEYDGVFEALAARDAEQGNLIDEPIATAEVLHSRTKTDYPAGLGQNYLVPTSELAPEHVDLFSFPTFNRMQSKVFADIYGGDENIVVTAPTSSGKTVIFELAYLRMRKESPGRLAIYMAPTKALCSERARDWKHRFGTVGTCVEITGDTNTVGLDRLLATANLLVITPEKLDVLSRKSAKYTSLDNLGLVMIDEVHILGESRGATLEVVMSRLKKRCTSYEPIRFVAVSATVPNIKDVAKWLAPPRTQITTGVFINGVNEETEIDPKEERMQLATMPEAKLWQFGEDFRPVPLTKIVQGYDGNDWTLGKKLDQELMPLIFEHGKGKPIMVFCPTRKSCQATAALLHEKYQDICNGASSSRRPPPWPRSRTEANFVDPQLKTWWGSGIAVHHAGIENTDRRVIEDGYRDGSISVICCTSTLAVGVNLPAHLVVIKGTQTWAGAANGMREYSDVDIQQMMGRAGRPQYDTSGTVIIMCEKSKVGMYRQKIFSKTVLESCLHTSLSEHINSEVGLGTISSLKGAQEWLEGSFLWIRIQQNPRAYTSIKKTQGNNESWDKVLEKYVKLGLQQLRKIELVTHRGWNEEVKKAESMADDDPMEELSHTALGKIMSECCIQLGTMESIVELGPGADLQDCLETLSGACEFEDLRVRQGEAGFLNQLRANPEIRFPLEDPVKTYADKVFLLLQGRFAAVEWDSVKTKTKTENSSAQQTLFTIYQSAPRIAQAIARVLTTRNYGLASKYGLQLLRIVNGKSWEDQASVFQQLRQIGPKSMKVLGANNILTWKDLIKTPPAQLEHWLARNAPFGSTLIREALAKDRYEVILKQTLPATKDQDGFPVVTFTVILKNEKKGGEEKTKDGNAKWAKRSNLSILTIRSDGGWIDYRRALAKKMIKTEFELSTELTAADQTIEIGAGVDETSGLTTKAILDPDLSQLGEIDYAACHQRRVARELEEAKERKRALAEADGEKIPERDAETEEMKKRDHSVRNRKVRAEDFRKETADEGGWTKSKAVPKRLAVPGQDADKTTMSDTDVGDNEDDEAMEDNRFDGGEKDGRSKGDGSRQMGQSDGPKKGELTASKPRRTLADCLAQKIKSKRPKTGVAQYIEDSAEESDDEEGEEEEMRYHRNQSSRHRSEKTSRRSDFINDSNDSAGDISDGAIEELIDCTVPEYVPQPGSKRDLQQRGLAVKRRRPDPDSAEEEIRESGKRRSRKEKRERSRSDHSDNRSISPSTAIAATTSKGRPSPSDNTPIALVSQPGVGVSGVDLPHDRADREDSLEYLLRPKPTTSRSSASHAHPPSGATAGLPDQPTPLQADSDPMEENDDWLMGGGDISHYIIEPNSDQAHPHVPYDDDIQPDQTGGPEEQDVGPDNDDFNRPRTSKSRVRFASQDEVQQMEMDIEGGLGEVQGDLEKVYDDQRGYYETEGDYGGSQAEQQQQMEYGYEETQPVQDMYRQGDDQAEELAYDYQPIQHALQNDVDYTLDDYNDGGEEYSQYLEPGGTQQVPDSIHMPHYNHNAMASSDSMDPEAFEQWMGDHYTVEG